MQQRPKLRGFTSHRSRPVTVNIARIAATFKDDEKVFNCLSAREGNYLIEEAQQGVKIVGASGKIERSFTFDTETGNLTVTKRLLA
jgi:ribosomal protein L15